MRLSPLAVVDSGIDYLTCTYSTQAQMTRLLFYISRVERLELKSGNLHRSFGLSGYRGVHVGGLEYGHRHDGAIVRLSGPTAQRWWRRFYYLSTNCSRIDLQWTLTYDGPPHRIIEQQFRLMRKEWKKHKRFPEPKLIAGPLGGESIRSGERTSNVFLRLYHRGAKKGFADKWGHIRYEVEYKDYAARAVAKHLLYDRRVTPTVEAECVSRFSNRGCYLKGKTNGLHLYRCVNPSGDVNRRLAWFQNSVRPTVQALIALGYEREVLEALGLDHLVHLDAVERN
jgi:hypothetical protein